MEIVTYSKHISEKNITYVSFADFGSDWKMTCNDM